MTSKIVIGNLKMHAVGDILKAYQSNIVDEEFGLLVPYPYLSLAKERLKESPVWVGAQNVSPHQQGAYTGQVSAKMLTELEIDTVMIGHSEARGADVALQLQRAQEEKLNIIYCVGEDLFAYENNQREQILIEQLSVLDKVDNLMIAYEPVWSIGTGVLPEYKEIKETVKMIGEWLLANKTSNLGSIPLLYGGSINNKNCEEVLSQTEVDGFLVGGASLKPEILLEVVKRCR